jgi:soluble lytic murein transglycosylase-like protein
VESRYSRSTRRFNLTAGLLALLVASPLAKAAEHVTLRNGFEVDCIRREASGDRVRLYFIPSGTISDEANFLEVAADAVVRVDQIADMPRAIPISKTPAKPTEAATTIFLQPTKAEMQEMLAHAGATHHIDADLLASVVRAESGGNVHAVSRTGARGLMQLMPGTAGDMGVQDAFRADQNIAGGTAYLDALLIRYHDNIALALAAYNAGPKAVDRYRGVPPYAETRAYVARVIREFNRRKQGSLVAQAR